MNDRIRAFSRRLEDATAERREPFAHGTGLFCDSIPSVYDANYLRVERVTTAEEHASEADALMWCARSRARPARVDAIDAPRAGPQAGARPPRRHGRGP
jgi:hypothetical protein